MAYDLESVGAAEILLSMGRCAYQGVVSETST